MIKEMNLKNKKGTIPLLKTSKVERSVIRALKYSAVFKYPLSFYQIALYMDVRSTREALRSSLKSLVNKKIVEKDKETYKIQDSETSDWGEKMEKSKEIRDIYAKKLLRLKKIPWIRFLGFTGSLAASNYKDEDDIDILIITDKNRVWLTRMLVVLYLKAWGIYFSEKDQAGKVCPNLYLEINALSQSDDKRNVYVSAEITRIHPVINRNSSYELFLSVNSWVAKFAPNFSIYKFDPVNKSKKNLLDVFNKCAFFTQKMYMKSPSENEIISYNKIHFNKYDKSKVIIDKYKNLL